LRDLRYVTAGLSLEAAAAACGVDVRTFRRWESDNRAPLVMQKLLVCLSGELMHLDPQFKGFRIRDGKLFHDQAPYSHKKSIVGIYDNANFTF
jgi:transcriptional regulator with XRE-family HTH domain